MPRTPVSRTMIWLKERADGWTTGHDRGCASTAPTIRGHLRVSNPRRAMSPAGHDGFGGTPRAREQRFLGFPQGSDCLVLTHRREIGQEISKRPPTFQVFQERLGGTRVPANTGVPLKTSGSTWMTVAPRFIRFRIHLRRVRSQRQKAEPVRSNGRRSAREVRPIVSRLSAET